MGSINAHIFPTKSLFNIIDSQSGIYNELHIPALRERFEAERQPLCTMNGSKKLKSQLAPNWVPYTIHFIIFILHHTLYYMQTTNHDYGLFLMTVNLIL